MLALRAQAVVNMAIKSSVKNVLFFAYYFPPMGGCGFQRSFAFARFLGEYGYYPFVLSGLPNHAAEDINHTLLRKLTQASVCRLEASRGDSFTRAILENPIIRRLPWSQDRMVWWVPSAVRSCLRIAEENQIDILYTSLNPWAGARVGHIVSKKLKVPWVLDFRDPWAIDDIREYITYLHYWLDVRAMRQACEAATAIVMNTPAARDALLENFPNLSAKKVFCIPNGFDEDLVRPSGACRQSGESRALNVVYSGSFHTAWAFETDSQTRTTLGHADGSVRYWLKDAFLYRRGAPNLLCRGPYYFFRALQELIQNKRIMRNAVRVTIVGSVADIEKNIIHDLGLKDIVAFTGYLPYEESITALSGADVLLLTQHKPRKMRQPLSVPGKLFEYLRIGKPILGLVPEGDARKILVNSGMGVVADPDDVSGIADTIAGCISAFHTDGFNLTPNLGFIDSYSRRRLTQTLAQTFDYSYAAFHQSKRTCAGTAPPE